MVPCNPYRVILVVTLVVLVLRFPGSPFLPRYATVKTRLLLYGYNKAQFTPAKGESSNTLQNRMNVGVARYFNASSEAVKITTVGDEVPEVGVTPNPFWVEFEVKVKADL